MQNSPILLFLYSKIHGLYSQKPVPQNVTKLPIHKFWRERRAPPIVKHYMCDSLCAEIFNMVRGVCSICSCRAQLRHDIMASAHGWQCHSIKHRPLMHVLTTLLRYRLAVWHYAWDADIHPYNSVDICNRSIHVVTMASLCLRWLSSPSCREVCHSSHELCKLNYTCNACQLLGVELHKTNCIRSAVYSMFRPIGLQ